jgi:ribonuclease HI
LSKVRECEVQWGAEHPTVLHTLEKGYILNGNWEPLIYMPAPTDKSDQSLTLAERVELAEKRLAEALQQLEQERRRTEAMEAKLQELNIPLDFLPSTRSEIDVVSHKPNLQPSQPQPVQESSPSIQRIHIQRIYTDGACSGNPGPGGWGVVIYCTDGSVHELGGSAPRTTNNRMEMEAAIHALSFFKATEQSEPIELYTDSEYVLKGITEWIRGWKRKGWKNSKGKPVENQDLWQRLDLLNSPAVRWVHVRGHSGDEGNERCDEIARGFSLGTPPELRQCRALYGVGVDC